MARVTDPETAVLGAQVLNMEIRLARAGVLTGEGTLLNAGTLIIGPDDLEHDPELTRFQGFALLRVPHWQGRPVVGVAGDWSVAGVYFVARQIQNAGVDVSRIRAFGPAGWEHVSVPLIGSRNMRVDFVPADGLDGPMIGVELT